MAQIFTVDFVSPVDFDFLAAEISYRGQIVCRVTNERDDGELEVDFFYLARDPLEPITVPFQELLKLLTDVGSELRQNRINAAPE